jgi:hypothetical protein
MIRICFLLLLFFSYSIQIIPKAFNSCQNKGNEFDYIVIGSGIGLISIFNLGGILIIFIKGGILACNLAKKGFKTLLIEAGDDQSSVIYF